MIFDFLVKYARFKPARLKDSRGPVTNPSRGWYQIFYFHIPELPDFQELRWCLREDEAVAMAVIDIGAYRDSALNQMALDAISQILVFFQQNEKDLILRFTYDCEGKGLLHEPALFSQVEEHIHQLSPIIHSHTKTIFVLQGLFIGSWGEMHGSKFLSSVHIKRINALVEAAAGEHTWLAIRRPCQWRALHGPNEKNVRMGLFDDGIFGSDSNLGTFGYLQRFQARWENPWCPEDELAFEEQLCMVVPHGGEVICPQQSNALSGGRTISLLRRMRISYLNCVYDTKLLDQWKRMRSPWIGINLYDYVGAHLGYRFCVRQVSVRKRKQELWLGVTIENTGFAPCYEEHTVALEIVDDGNVVCQELSWELRDIMAGTIRHWECALPERKGDLFLSVRRKKDGRYVRFSNDTSVEGKLPLGCLI